MATTRKQARKLARYLSQRGIPAESAHMGGGHWAAQVRVWLPDLSPAFLHLGPDLMPVPEGEHPTTWDLVRPDGDTILSGGWAAARRREVLREVGAFLRAIDALVLDPAAPVDHAAVQKVIRSYVDRWTWTIARDTARYARALVNGQVSADLRDVDAIVAAVPEINEGGEAALCVEAIHALAAGAFYVEQLNTRYGTGHDGVWSFYGPEFPQHRITPEQFHRAFHGDVVAAAHAFLRSNG
ncbi:hypothetical protein, partial [Streptacidiphilus monticola]